MIVTTVESPRQADVIALLEEGDRFTRDLYPPDSCYLLNVDELEKPGVAVFVARDDAVAVGMAALVDRGDGSAEIKRMFVAAEARGLGIARGILRALEEHAVTTGVSTIQLETGPLQHAAIALYERSGFRSIPNFGPYVGDDFSVCYEKLL